MSLATVQRVYLVPDNSRADQNDKETSVTLVYRIEFTAGSTYTLPFPFQGLGGATDGTTTVPAYGDDLNILTGSTEPTGLTVNKITPQANAESPHVLDTYVTFSSTAITPLDTGKWNVDISVSGARFTETVTRYSDGTLIVNSAGDLYDPMQVKIYYDERISITFTTDSVDGNTLATLRGKVNSDAVTMTIKGISRSFAINTLLMDEISYKVVQTGATGVTSSTFSTYNVAFDMIYRIDTWKAKLVDAGTRDINHKPFQNGQGAGLAVGTGNNVTAPIYLDGAGGALIGAGTSVTASAATMAVIVGNKLIQDPIAFLPFLTGIA